MGTFQEVEMKTEEVRQTNQQSEASRKEAPTPEEVVVSVELSFQQNVKPIWAEWDKDVIIIVGGHMPR